MQEIASLVVAPIERDGRLVGFLGMDNPPADQIRDIAPLLRTLCYFYSMTLQRIENERQLVAMSYHDSLTGLYNRNRYNEDVRRLEKLARPFGAVFLDVNGMKEINDRGGHAEGDHLLQACAQTMQRVLGEVARLYRVGGDEFVATVVDTDEAGFRSLVWSGCRKRSTKFRRARWLSARNGRRDRVRSIERCSMQTRRCTAISAVSTRTGHVGRSAFSTCSRRPLRRARKGEGARCRAGRHAHGAAGHQVCSS
ncbi:MAG: GGDEF domain-containing protein [Adlercreutzia sp.]